MPWRIAYCETHTRAYSRMMEGAQPRGIPSRFNLLLSLRFIRKATSPRSELARPRAFRSHNRYVFVATRLPRLTFEPKKIRGTRRVANARRNFNRLLARDREPWNGRAFASRERDPTEFPIPISSRLSTFPYLKRGQAGKQRASVPKRDLPA
jgi:hypothetical protein